MKTYVVASMRVSKTRQLVEQACEFPIEHETVAASLGDVLLDCPNGEAVSVASVLERSDHRRYGSADELYNVILGNLDESFVGRKYYDDRGGVNGASAWSRSRTRSI